MTSRQVIIPLWTVPELNILQPTYFTIYILEPYSWFSVPGTASNVPTPVPVPLFKVFSGLLLRNCYLEHVIFSEPEHSEQLHKNNKTAYL